MDITSIKRKIRGILRKSGVRKAALFGSYARGDIKKFSDVDILVEFDHSAGLMDFVDLKDDLERAIGIKVDLVTYKGLHPRLKDIVLNEQKIIYEKRS